MGEEGWSTLLVGLDMSQDNGRLTEYAGEVGCKTLAVDSITKGLWRTVNAGLCGEKLGEAEK